jgi:PAS domain S-box-containing protein
MQQMKSFVKDSLTTHLINTVDWGKTPLGGVETWSDSLQNTIKTCLHSKFPTLLMLGEDMIQIYNDAYSELIGLMHPNAFGVKAKEVWDEFWQQIGPMLESVLKQGKSYLFENNKFILSRKGYPEDCYFTFSYSPIFGNANTIEGICILVTETTQEVSNEQRLKLLRNKQLKNLFEQAPVAMSILSGPAFLIEVANKEMLELWGKTAEAVMDKPVFDALPDARNQGYEDLLNKVYTTGERVVIEESPLTLIRNGKTEEFFIKLVYEALREENGTISGIMVVADEVTHHVKAKKQIEESEIRQKLAIEAAAIGTFDWDILNSTFQYSDRFAKMFGYNETGGLNQSSFAERIHPDDQSMRIAAHQHAFKTGSLFYEARTIWPDNSVHWIRLNGKVLYDQNGRPARMHGTTLDISDQKSQTQTLEKLVEERTFKLQQRNEELKRSEERYHKMVEEVQDYAIISLNKEGIIESWNKGAEKIKGYKEEEILGKSFINFYLPEDKQKKLPQTLMNEAIRNGKAVHEGWRVRKDGSRFWGSITITALHDDNNNIIGFSKVTRDLSERKINEDQLKDIAEELKKRNEELKRSEERYHKMISEVQDYAIILLDTNGTILNWNKGAEKIKGYKGEEIIGKNFTIFYLPEDQQNNLPQKLINEAITNGKAVNESWRLRKDGTKFWGSITITALHDDHNNVIGFSKVTRDLTERKIAEDRMLQYTAELESQNTELQQFAYVASHDLQEPLRKIQAFSELIQKNLKDEMLVTKYFDKISSSAHRMTDLIKSLLNYSRLSEEGKDIVVDVDLDKILRGVLSDFELLIQEKNAVIQIEPMPVIKGVTLQLHQLFANLIGNALKFNEKEPVIVVKCRIVETNEIIHKPNALPEGKYFEFSVSDNGIGFEQEYAPKIFSIFQRLHGKLQYAGTGIGLALCKKIAENHKGHITAVSALGKGATFYVYFPSPKNEINKPFS